MYFILSEEPLTIVAYCKDLVLDVMHSCAGTRLSILFKLVRSLGIFDVVKRFRRGMLERLGLIRFAESFLILVDLAPYTYAAGPPGRELSKHAANPGSLHGDNR